MNRYEPELLEATYELFEKHAWGDGLPLVPPTASNSREPRMISFRNYPRAIVRSGRD